MSWPYTRSMIYFHVDENHGTHGIVRGERLKSRISGCISFHWSLILLSICRPVLCRICGCLPKETACEEQREGLMDCCSVSAGNPNIRVLTSRHGSPCRPCSFLSSPSLACLSIKPQQAERLGRRFSLVSYRVDSTSLYRRHATLSETCSTVQGELADIEWENLGFGLVPTDYMYVMKCSEGGTFSESHMEPFGNIKLSPAAGVLNYGQGLFEGLKAYRKHDGTILLFRPAENALRMITGAERMCMSVPTVEQFIDAIKATVMANKRWVPPFGKGSLYIRPLLIGSGTVLGLAPSPEYTFLVYASPVGNYFKGGLKPIKLIVETEMYRAARGGTGGVKTIGNYASVLKVQTAAKAEGYSDVLYLDSVHTKYLEEVSSSNIFVVKIQENLILTPQLEGTILPGVTRKSVIDVAISLGYRVKECRIPVDDLAKFDEVFCTGTAVVVCPVGSITFGDEKYTYGQTMEDGTKRGIGKVTEQIYKALTSIQTGIVEDTNNWVMELK